MFSELLSEGRVTEPDKERTYLAVMASESARLTRLINNVLDFAKLERGQKKYDLRPCELDRIAREVVETYRPHLEAGGFRFECRLPDRAVPVLGDRDALAQVIVNLLSNAEKYSGEQKERCCARRVLRSRRAPGAIKRWMRWPGTNLASSSWM